MPQRILRAIVESGRALEVQKYIRIKQKEPCYEIDPRPLVSLHAEFAHRRAQDIRKNPTRTQAGGENRATASRQRQCAALRPSAGHEVT